MFRTPRRLAWATALASVAALGVAMPTAGLAQTAEAQQGGELIFNGDAEADVGAGSNSEIVKPTGWTTTGEFTAVRYGASGGFPDANSPGPDERGSNFFAGGNAALSTATQTIDLAAYGAQISGGAAHFDFSGWLGGFEGQVDAASARLIFKDAAGTPIPGVAILQPVGPEVRHGATGLVRREATGVVPARARSAQVMIVITRREGTYNDGSVDNLSLVVK
jgi:hypothetical protein